MFCSLQLRSQEDNFIHVDVILEHNPGNNKQFMIPWNLRSKQTTFSKNTLKKTCNFKMAVFITIMIHSSLVIGLGFCELAKDLSILL